VELVDEHFRLLVEAVQDYAIYLLAPDGTIRSWNAGAQRLKGYASDEVLGRSFALVFTPEDSASEKPARLLEEALRAGRVEDAGWRLRKDGSQFWASTVLTALRDRSGAHIGFAKVTRDLTDRAYRAFVEAAHAIVWTTDADGRPNADSPSWREFTGQSEADWRRLRGWDPVHPDEVGALRVAWARSKADGSHFEAEFRMRRRDGEYVWMAAHAIPLRDEHGRIREWFGVTFDISARKHAELQTKRALELWATTLRSIGDAVITTDKRGEVRFVNPVAERLTGWVTAEAMGRPLNEVFPIFNERTGAAVENPVEKVLRHGVIVGLANHSVLRRKDGAMLPIDDSAAPIRDPDGSIEGVVLVFRDASEEKRELARRRFIAAATEELVEADDYRDALARVATLVVPQLADWSAVDLVETPGEPTKQIAVAHADPDKVEHAREIGRRYPPDPKAATGVPKVLRTGLSEFYPEIPRELLERAVVDAEHRRLLDELDLRSSIVVPLRGKRGVFGAITLVLSGERRYTERDLAWAEELADRAALLIERRRLEEEAAYANHMKDEFLATMSHELRTPLQAIIGYGGQLERGVARDEGKAIAAIMRNANAQIRLIEDILDVSRITSGKLRMSMTRVDLAAAIYAAVDSIRPAASARRLVLVEAIPPDLGDVRGDFDRLQQIVWNLLSNAVKFTDKGGTVELRAERTGSSVRVLVRDSGIGIAREHLTTVFERFRQIDSSTTRAHGGLGLGLALVRYLVEAHGGTVKAESGGTGTGATFTVTLPASVDAMSDANRWRNGDAALGERPLHDIRVLLVDDDEDTREILGDVIVEAGAIVTRAGSAAEAFERLLAESPHVLISDIGMPIEDGYSLLRRVRARAPESGGDVPAIALTAYARPEDVQAIRDAGFQQHVVKPVRAAAIIDAIRACTKRRGA
jgi:PAS domain S-box-containing protein